MNIVVVCFDSLRQDHVGIYGNKWIQTPNLDAFAKEAVAFTRCYPESVPTLQFRRALHTGQRTFPFLDTQFYKGDVDPMPGWGPIPQEQDTVSEILGANGYRSAFITDAYHQFKASKNFHRGFDSYEFIRGQETDKYRSGPEIPDDVVEKHLNAASKDNEAIKAFLKKYLMNVSDRKSEEDYFPAKVFNKASQWLLENQTADKILMVVDSFDPHEPWDPPEYYRKLYDPDDDTVDHIQSLYCTWEGNISERELKRMKANYAGEVTMCDRWFGHFMEALKLSGRLDDTVVMVVSDHGHNLGYDPGDKGYISKQGYPMTRGVCDLVCIIRHPSGEGAGSVCDKLIYNVDLPYTLLNMAGIEPPEVMQGMDVWPAVLDPSIATRDYVTIAWGPAITVINDQWWYNANIWGEGSLLYNIKTDPEHVDNLAEQHPGVCEQMRELAIKDAGGSIPELLEKYRNWPACGLQAWGDRPYGTAARHAKWR
jgi:arylsulfatase A-like enzyme